jgi:hypothetical protein
MNEIQNIMEISNPNNIIELLHREEFFYTVFFITSDKVPLKMNKYMKKWLMTVSKKYPNVLFCYYHASNADFKKAVFYDSLDNDDPDKKNNKGYSLIKPPNKDNYPLSYYFVGTSDIVLQGSGITPAIINDAYKTLEEHFNTDLEKVFPNRIKELNQDLADNTTSEKDKPTNTREEYKKNIILQKEMQFNDKLEKDKLNEKITVVGKYAKTYLKEFINDLQKREKIEKGEYSGEDSESSSDDKENNDNDNHDSDNNSDGDGDGDGDSDSDSDSDDDDDSDDDSGDDDDDSDDDSYDDSDDDDSDGDDSDGDDSDDSDDSDSDDGDSDDKNKKKKKKR